MAIGFTEFGTVTSTDSDPNGTPPSPSRIISAPNKQQNRDFPSRLSLAARFTAGTTPNVDVTVWVKDNHDNAGVWYELASVSSLDGTVQVLSNVPPNAELFAQVTAINGSPTDATVVGHFH